MESDEEMDNIILNGFNDTSSCFNSIHKIANYDHMMDRDYITQMIDGITAPKYLYIFYKKLVRNLLKHCPNLKNNQIIERITH